VKVVVLRLVSERFFVPRVSWRRLRELVGSADIVHLMGHWTVLNALVYWASRAQGKPYVVCPAGALAIYGRSRALKRFYNAIVGKRIIRDARACIAITPDEFVHFEAYGVERSRVVVIPNGISAEDFERADAQAFRAKFGLGVHPFVLFMGRLDHIKGPDLLLRAFCRVHARFPDVHLVFAGPDSGMRDGLVETVRNHDLAARVHFTGSVAPQDKSSAYRAAMLLAIPSRHEAMSIVVLEGGISGIPVLLTDRCGFDVIDGRGAKVVEATEEALAQGLAELLAAPEQLPAMGATLRAVTRETYQWQSVIRGYISLYNTLLENGPLPREPSRSAARAGSP
jgi:glycosyltransferase involved in cell wall biosynthesis